MPACLVSTHGSRQLRLWHMGKMFIVSPSTSPQGTAARHPGLKDKPCQQCASFPGNCVTAFLRSTISQNGVISACSCLPPHSPNKNRWEEPCGGCVEYWPATFPCGHTPREPHPGTGHACGAPTPSRCDTDFLSDRTPSHLPHISSRAALLTTFTFKPNQ